MKVGRDIMSLMRRRFFALLLLATTLCAHAQMIGYYPKGGPDIAAEDVSMIQLIANPQTYDGKTVHLIGFIHLEFEGNVIYLHEEDFRHGLTKNGLWIDLPKGITQAQIKSINDQYVICTAQFEAKMHGHMGLNSGEVTHVTRLEVWPAYQGAPPPPPSPPVRH